MLCSASLRSGHGGGAGSLIPVLHEVHLAHAVLRQVHPACKLKTFWNSSNGQWGTIEGLQAHEQYGEVRYGKGYSDCERRKFDSLREQKVSQPAGRLLHQALHPTETWG